MYKESEMPRNSYFGNKEPIPELMINAVQDIFEQLKVPVAWQKNDVLLINNLLVAHGRQSYTGKRKVRVAMTD